MKISHPMPEVNSSQRKSDSTKIHEKYIFEKYFYPKQSFINLSLRSKM